MAVNGGLRARLIKDSLYRMLNESLTALGWFDENRNHLPISFPAVPVDDGTEIALNTMSLSDGDVLSSEWEMGSDMKEHQWSFFVDFYAEKSTLGLHVAHDIKAILEGSHPDIGRERPTFSVYGATDPDTELFVAHVEDVSVDRAHGFPNPWQKNWYAVTFTVIDYHWSD
jgi:hypothetical protein